MGVPLRQDDGLNGLITGGSTTFGDLPRFPHIRGTSSAVAGWNSRSCASRWALNKNAPGKRRTVIVAVDPAAPGFNIALSAMNELTGGTAVQFGGVDVIDFLIVCEWRLSSDGDIVATFLILAMDRLSE
jgi:hypothetical protein